MPELPEVETIIRRLRNGTPGDPGVIDQTIQSVRNYLAKIIAAPSLTNLNSLCRVRQSLHADGVNSSIFL